MARYYFYSHGAFMSPDPLLGHAIDPQTWNRYSYGLDDPINFVDPSGLCWTIDNQNIDDYDTGPCYTVTVTTPLPSQTTIDWFFESLWSSWGYQGQPDGTNTATESTGNNGFTLGIRAPTIGPDRSQSNLPACAAVDR